MVYIPWAVVKRYMMRRRREDPSQPKPSISDIDIQWYRWLDWCPPSSEEFERFKLRFPPRDREQIYFRVVHEFRKPVEKRRPQSYRPIAEPLGDEPV